jgi:shikimate 5-dehydrogenase/3-dehydroquinate dehydratase
LRSRRIVQTLATPRDAVDDRVDLLEWRLDLYPDAPIPRLPKPYIATVRRKEDGGAFERGDRAALFARARGAAYYDLEVGAADVPLPAGVRVIRSVHGNRFDLDAMDGDLVKVVTRPHDVVGAMRILGVGFALGDEYAFTRVLAPLTYCARTPLAPGMPTPEQLFDEIDIRRLSLRPGLFGVAGYPVAHSESPALHNPALRRDGLDAVYLRFPVKDLAPFWPLFLEKGGLGLSVTAPLKEQAAELATDPDPDVKACGAANTLLRDGRAHNTDLRAFLELIPEGRGDALVLGAGGAARAALVALRRRGYRVRVWARRPERAAALGPVAPSPAPADVVVNTTPLPCPEGGFVVDLVYGPERASADVDGRAFLRAQARHQYRLFTGGELP